MFLNLFNKKRFTRASMLTFLRRGNGLVGQPRMSCGTTTGLPVGFFHSFFRLRNLCRVSLGRDRECILLEIGSETGILSLQQPQDGRCFNTESCTLWSSTTLVPEFSNPRPAGTRVVHYRIILQRSVVWHRSEANGQLWTNLIHLHASKTNIVGLKAQL